ncbi:MAG: porin [Burkholderia sp.]|nr:MAG: Outer membrane porin protein [Burkholderia gladioli]
MKKTLIVAAAAASFATVAHAQSSVTLYGVLDAGITYQSNLSSKSRWLEGTGIDQSLFGLRGLEDLGDGLKTIFTLESGFGLGNGHFSNDGGIFNRKAFVGLSSQSSTVTLGRQYDAVQDYLAPLTATGSWGGTYFAHLGNLDNLSTNGGYATNNSIKFTSGNYTGLQFGGTYAFSNNAHFRNNRAYSGGASYQFEGLKLAGAYSQLNYPNAAGTSGAVNQHLFGAPQSRVRTYGAAAGYVFGPAQVGAAWTQARLHNAVADANVQVANYEVNGTYNLTPALGLGVAYAYSSGRVGTNNTHSNQVGLQADYSLSKRTDVYAQAVYHRASKGVNASIYNGESVAQHTLLSGISQTAATVGLRHRF